MCSWCIRFIAYFLAPIIKEQRHSDAMSLARDLRPLCSLETNQVESIEVKERIFRPVIGEKLTWQTEMRGAKNPMLRFADEHNGPDG